MKIEYPSWGEDEIIQNGYIAVWLYC